MKRWRKPEDTPEDGVGLNEARKAIRHASEIRDEARRRDEDVRDIAERLREVRTRNHFGELLTRAIREGR